MAKKNNTRYRRNKGGRLDMRKGGRVALQLGGTRRTGRAEEEALRPRVPPVAAPAPPPATTTAENF